MSFRYLAWLLAIGFSLVGMFAFSFSETFFGLLGDYYGSFNEHFVKDAGIAFFCSGFLLILSNTISEWEVPLTFSGTLFVILHGLFHIQMLFTGMAPDFQSIMKEVLIIIVPSILSLLLLTQRVWKHRSAETPPAS